MTSHRIYILSSYFKENAIKIGVQVIIMAMSGSSATVKTLKYTCSGWNESWQYYH